MVDLAVYTKNRLFRLTHCSKRGNTAPLLRISKDPLVADFTGSLEDHTIQLEAALSMILTSPFVDSDTIVVEAPDVKPSAPKQMKTQKEDSGPGVSTHPDSDIELPFPACHLKEVLKSHGDSVSEPSSVKYLDGDSSCRRWKVQCNQNKQSRPCLICPAKNHRSNNCILFVRPMDDHTLQVEYHCTSQGCKRESLVLGHFQLDPSFRWKFTKENLAQD